jgi:IS30 family transposase
MKLTQEDVKAINVLLKSRFMTSRKIAKMFHVHHSTIEDIKKKVTWVPAKQKLAMAKRIESVRGEKNHCAKLTEKEVLRIRKRVKSESFRSVARAYNISPQAISLIAKRKTWKHI